MALVKTNTLAATEDNHLFDESPSSFDMLVCRNPDKLMRLVQAIRKSEHVHFISDGDWSMHDLVMQLLEIYKPAQLFITTYAIREFPIRQLIMAQDKGDITNVKMLLDYRAKVRTPEVYHLASMNINSIFLTSIHAKVTVIKSDIGSVAIVASANWTQNPRIEAGVVTTNKEAAEFHINWIEKAMANATIFD
jgi:hypothetical protein